MPGADQLVEHLFRHQAGRITATLTRQFGSSHFDLVEDAVQEALISALRVWPIAGIPTSPEGWLLATARNRAIDRFRRDAKQSQQTDQFWLALATTPLPEVPFPDDTLTLLFLCCHPALTEEVSLAIMLKSVCGFSVEEIAWSFVAAPQTIAQRLVRAKRLIRESNIHFAMPSDAELPARRATVLKAIYLLFNEGHSRLRFDLCEEAIRLAEMLIADPRTNCPEADALAALCLLSAARMPAREFAGELLSLEEQDRTLWNPELLHRGFLHFIQCARGDEETIIHLEAALAAEHAKAPNFAQTDWIAIAALYERLRQKNDSPIVAINRAIAIGHALNALAAQRELLKLDGDPRLRHSQLLDAAWAWTWRELGNSESARISTQQAIAKSASEMERQYLRKLMNGHRNS